MLGQVDFSLIPVWLIDDLSLLYGGSSLLEGSGALGGAVLLKNKPEWNHPLNLSLHQEFASFGTFGSYGRIEMGNEAIRSNTRLYWNRSENNYPYLNTDVIPNKEERLRHAAYRKGGLLQEIYIRPGDRNDLSIRLWYQDANRNLPPVMSYEGSDRTEKQEDQILRTSLEWDHYRPFGTLTLRTGYANAAMGYQLYQLDHDYNQFDTRSQENSLYNTARADLKTGNSSRLRLQMDYNRHEANIQDQVRLEGYRHIRNEFSLLAGSYHELGTDWMIFALLRQEWADGKWLPIMPSAGFRYHIAGRQKLYLKGILSRNYNLPSLNDLYWVPGGNPDLRPENSINSDLGIEYSTGNEILSASASINLYAAWVEDWIIWKPTRFRYWEPENVKRVFSRGLESKLGGDLLAGDWLFSLKVNYALTRSTNEGETVSSDGSRGKQLIYIPVHTGNLYINISRNGYYLNWSTNFTGKRYTQPGDVESSFEVILNPYCLQDLYLGKSWKVGRSQVGLQLVIYNLFNVSYQAVLARPMPMRNYAVNLRWEI
jgi:iron complex outermembrane receptor protein